MKYIVQKMRRLKRSRSTHNKRCWEKNYTSLVAMELSSSEVNSAVLGNFPLKTELAINRDSSSDQLSTNEERLTKPTIVLSPPPVSRSNSLAVSDHVSGDKTLETTNETIALKPTELRGIYKASSESMPSNSSKDDICKGFIRDSTKSPIPKKVRFSATTPLSTATSLVRPESINTSMATRLDHDRFLALPRPTRAGDHIKKEGCLDGEEDDYWDYFHFHNLSSGKDSLGPIIATIHLTHSRYAYDRSPIAVESDFNRLLDLPPRSNSYCDNEELEEERAEEANQEEEEKIVQTQVTDGQSWHRCHCFSLSAGEDQKDEKALRERFFEASPTSSDLNDEKAHSGTVEGKNNSKTQSTSSLSNSNIGGQKQSMVDPGDNKEKKKNDSESENSDGRMNDQYFVGFPSAPSWLEIAQIIRGDHLPSCYYSDPVAALSIMRHKSENNFINMTPSSCLPHYEHQSSSPLLLSLSSISSSSSASSASMSSTSSTASSSIPSFSSPLLSIPEPIFKMGDTNGIDPDNEVEINNIHQINCNNINNFDNHDSFLFLQSCDVLGGF